MYICYDRVEIPSVGTRASSLSIKSIRITRKMTPSGKTFREFMQDIAVLLCIYLHKHPLSFEAQALSHWRDILNEMRFCPNASASM